MSPAAERLADAGPAEGRLPGTGGQPERVSRMFWLAFFLPLNTLFHALAHAVLGIELTVDDAVWPTIIVKTLFFVLVTYAVLALWAVWRAAGSVPVGRRWGYLLLGQACIGIFLALHGGQAYRFGLLEREIAREVRKLNASELPLLPGGVRFNGVRATGRDWYSEYVLTDVSLAQLDPAQFRAAARPPLLAAVCADAWLQRLIAAKIAIHIGFRDRDGKVVMDETLGRGDCGGGN